MSVPGEDSVRPPEEEEELPLYEPRSIIFGLVLAASAALIFSAIDFYFVVYLSMVAFLRALF